MCGHTEIGFLDIPKITVVDSNDVVNHWLMTGAINKAAFPRFLSDNINGLSFLSDST